MKPLTTVLLMLLVAGTPLSAQRQRKPPAELKPPKGCHATLKSLWPGLMRMVQSPEFKLVPEDPNLNFQTIRFADTKLDKCEPLERERAAYYFARYILLRSAVGSIAEIAVKGYADAQVEAFNRGFEAAKDNAAANLADQLKLWREQQAEQDQFNRTMQLLEFGRTLLRPVPGLSRPIPSWAYPDSP